MMRHIFATAFKPTVMLVFVLSGTMVARAHDPVKTQTVGSAEIHVNQNLLEGIHLLYERQFNEAEALFLELKEKFPEKTAAYFYLAMVTWSRLAAGFWSPEHVAQYKKRIDRTVAIAKSRIESGKGDSYTYFYLGGALGFDGRFELMKGNWITSFFLASDAIDALKICHQMDPANKDVLLGLGTFDYYTARLSGVLKFLTYFLLHKGDKAEGLRKLDVAAKEAVYSATEAKSMLLHIYLFLENDPQKALDISRELSKTYALNPRFKVLEGVSCIRLGKEASYEAVVKALQKASAERKDASVAAVWRRRAVYLEAIHDLFKGDYAKARARLWAILADQDPEHDPGMMAWPRLKIGMSYDLQGKRDQAISFYEDVLTMENGAGAQFLAKKLLKNPPRKEDPFIGY